MYHKTTLVVAVVAAAAAVTAMFFSITVKYIITKYKFSFNILIQSVYHNGASYRSCWPTRQPPPPQKKKKKCMQRTNGDTV